jgi:hypothetical protein
LSGISLLTTPQPFKSCASARCWTSRRHSPPATRKRLVPEDETFDIGEDTRTGVALLEYRYDVPFKFTGKINKLTFNLGPQQLTAEEREEMQKTVARTRLEVAAQHRV